MSIAHAMVLPSNPTPPTGWGEAALFGLGPAPSGKGIREAYHAWLMQIAGLILAGGQSRRMGGVEKAFVTLGGEPMIVRIARIVAPQCRFVAVSAQYDLTRFGELPAIADTRSQGPMSGLAQAMDWIARHRPEISHVLSVPSDTPFLPGDLGARLSAALQPGLFASIAASGGRLHPVIGMWPIAVRTPLEEALSQGVRSFHAMLDGKTVATVEWPGMPHDPFFNVNTPEDLADARAKVTTNFSTRAGKDIER